MKTFLNSSSVPRGLRNNNPGNLVLTNIAWQGKIPKPQNNDTNNGVVVKHFEQFTNLEFGIRAMLKDLINDINKGKNTINKIISEYAPPTENNTGVYIQSVSKTLGVTPNQTLTHIDSKFLLNLSRAIFKVELGSQHTKIVDSDILGAISKLGEVSTNLLTVSIDQNFFFKMKNFFIQNKKIVIGVVIALVVGVVAFFALKHKK